MENSVFKHYFKSQGLRQSSRRDRVVDTFLSLKGHTSAEELLSKVRKKDKRVGLTTIYRTMKLLTRCGLAVERKFNRQESTFEPARLGQHHDHLICLGCGRIMEFENKTIETLQETVGLDHAFFITHHVLELYGYCLECSQKTKKKLNSHASKRRHEAWKRIQGAKGSRIQVKGVEVKPRGSPEGNLFYSSTKSSG